MKTKNDESAKSVYPFEEYYSILFGAAIMQMLLDERERGNLGPVPDRDTVTRAARAAGRVIARYYDRRGGER